ncbi:unnamed protein product [Arctogadus glacialis]
MHMDIFFACSSLGHCCSIAVFFMTDFISDPCPSASKSAVCHVPSVQMELPFTGFELSFLLIAFIVFSLLSLASICYEADASRAGRHACEPIQLNKKHRVISKDARQQP